VALFLQAKDFASFIAAIGGRQKRVEYSHSRRLVVPEALPEPGSVVSAIAPYRVLV
jgi:hypothetical protein